jgi:hypothetical protein
LASIFKNPFTKRADQPKKQEKQKMVGRKKGKSTEEVEENVRGEEEAEPGVESEADETPETNQNTSSTKPSDAQTETEDANSVPTYHKPDVDETVQDAKDALKGMKPPPTPPQNSKGPAPDKTVAQLEKEIFADTQNIGEFKREETEQEISKAYYISDLYRRVKEKIYVVCFELGRVLRQCNEDEQNERVTQFILLLLKSDNRQEFLESWTASVPQIYRITGMEDNAEEPTTPDTAQNGSKRGSNSTSKPRSKPDDPEKLKQLHDVQYDSLKRVAKYYVDMCVLVYEHDPV